jgi:hypothetical protein
VPTAPLVLPALAVCLLGLSARARRALDALAPLQFALLFGGAILATRASGAPGVGCATAGILLATAGLTTTVLRKERLAHRSAYAIDWEKFELDFRFYALTERLWRR